MNRGEVAKSREDTKGWKSWSVNSFSISSLSSVFDYYY